MTSSEQIAIHEMDHAIHHLDGTREALKNEHDPIYDNKLEKSAIERENTYLEEQVKPARINHKAIKR